MPNMTVPKLTESPLIAKIGRFLVSGGSSALVNLLLLHGLVGVMGLRGGWKEDLANLVAIELSALFQFALCRHWVWRNAPQVPLWRGLFAFHGAIAMTLTGRTLLFTLLRQAGIHYLPNAVLGIALAAIANFLLYERFVFKGR